MNPLPPVPQLLADARAAAGVPAAEGIGDLGDDADRFMAALAELHAAVGRDSALPEEGAAAAALRWRRLLANRLRVQADVAAHPEIREQPLAPPLVICGLPRVGSTKLHQLLARTDDFQSLLFWQGFNPGRRARNPDGSDPRLAEAVEFLEWRSRRNPRSNAAHFLAANEPEEDTYLLEYTLHSYWPVSYFEVPTFLSWLERQDREHAYAYLRLLLQYLQWQFRPRDLRPWVLKSPPNLGFEAQMSRQLPGARFVMLHRDPVESIPSTVAIVRELRRLYGDGARDLRVVGQWALREYSGAMQRHLQWRDSLPDGAVLDLRYADVVSDYETVVERVYEHCGLALTGAARDRMGSWAGDNEQHKHGVHQYTLDESGLTEAALHDAFRDYYIRYGSLLAR